MTIDHVQLAAPAGGEEQARAFFTGILELEEQTKPENLRARGGAWFAGRDIAIHVGIDPEFTPQKKAHPALSVENLDDLADRLEQAGYPVSWDRELPGTRRFFTEDPFGNRIEFVSAGNGFLRQKDDVLWRAVDSYYGEKLLAHDPYLETVLATNDGAGLPRWEVSPLQAQFLAVLIVATKARRVLEVGTLGGYSTIFLGRSIPADGAVISLELDEHHAQVARKNIAGAGLAERVEVRTGAAAELMEQMCTRSEPPFDMIFIDADKRNNPTYMKLARRLARRGTVIVTDNVVRAGAVIDPERTDADTTGVRELADLLSHEPESVSTVIQTVGVKGHDGFAITVVT